MKIGLQRRLEFLRHELERLDGTGQPTAPLQREIARLQAILSDLEGRRIVPPSEGKERFAAMRAHVNRSESSPALASDLLEDDEFDANFDFYDLGGAAEAFAQSDEYAASLFPEAVPWLLQHGFKQTNEPAAYAPAERALIFKLVVGGYLNLYVQVIFVSNSPGLASTIIGSTYDNLFRYSLVGPTGFLPAYLEGVLDLISQYNVDDDERLRSDAWGDLQLALRRHAVESGFAPH